MGRASTLADTRNVVRLNMSRHEAPVIPRSRYMDNLLRREAAAAALYEIFSMRIKERRKFWSDLAHEQLAQADVLRALNACIDRGDIEYRPPPHSMAEAEDVLQFVKNLVDHLRRAPLTHAQALDHALKVEQSIHHGQLMDAFEPVSPQMEFEVQSFRTHLSHHVTVLEKEQRRSTPLIRRMMSGSRHRQEHVAAPEAPVASDRDRSAPAEEHRVIRVAAG